MGGAARQRALTIGGLFLIVGCSSGGLEVSGSQSGAVTAQLTLSELQARFKQRVVGAPQRLDPDLVAAPVVHRAVLSSNAKAAVTTKAIGFVSTGLFTMPLAADGAISLTSSNLSLKARLDGAATVAGAVADGYVVYPGAAPGGGATLLRPTDEGVEDYVVYEAAPSSPEATYTVEMNGVAGLRLVDNVLEFLDADGTPRLRARAPYIVDANEETTRPVVSVTGCAVDTSGVAPWGRPVTAPGSTSCTVRVSWAGSKVTYPAILDPEWTATSSMVEPRTKHTATALVGSFKGKALVLGGLNGSGLPVGAEIYDPGTDTWTITNTPDQKRSEHIMVRLADGKVLTTGGTTPGAPFLPNTEVYDPSTGNWTVVGSMGVGRRFASAELLPSGKVLVAGGWIQSTNDYTSSAEVYNPTTSSWTATGPLATARGEAMTAMLSSGKILMAGGAASTSSATNLASAEAYTESAGTWSSAGTMTNARFRAAIARTPANQKVIVAGGATSGTATATATTDLYDPTTNSWAAGLPMGTARMATAYTLMPGSVLLVAGGTDGTTSLSSVEAFDTLDNRWGDDDSLALVRENVPATVLSVGNLSRVLVAGLTTRGTGNAELRVPDHPLGESSSPYAVNVDWANPTLSGSLTSSTNIAGVAKNVGSSSLSVQIFTRAFGLDQRTVRRSVGTFTIPAGGTQNFNVLVSALPIQSVGMQSEVQLEAQYTPSGGTATVVPSAPLHYQFASGFGSATFTGWSTSDDTITTPAGTGTPFSRALESLRTSAATTHTFSGRYWNGSAFTTYTASSSTTKGTYLFRGPRHREYDTSYPPFVGGGDTSPGPGKFRICSTWRAQYKDAGKGEAYGNTTAPVDFTAAWSRFLITSTTANAPIVYSDYLKVDGCTGYLTLPAGNYIFAQDSVLNASEGLNIVYGGWDPRWTSIPYNGIPSSADPSFAGSEELYANWNTSEVTGFTVTASPVDLNLRPSYTDMAIRATATMEQISLTPDNGLSPPPLAPKTWFNIISNKVCPKSDPKDSTESVVEACGGPWLKSLNPPPIPVPSTWVFLGPTLDGKSHTTFSKVTIAHEFGHAVQAYKSGFQAYKYDWKTDITLTNPVCKCSHVNGSGSNDVHCIQSRQNLGGTQLEGYAQFYANRVWNDPASSSCVFNYYKPFLPVSGPVVQPPVIFSCKNTIGSNPKWMVTNCDSTNRGTEYDWMLFLYAINTASASESTTVESLASIYRLMCTGSATSNCSYSQVTTWNSANGILPAAASFYGGTTGLKYQKFLNTGVDTGVNR